MQKKAFTLVEILIVVSIIALLASIAIPNLLRSKIESNQAAAQATLKTISSALENYMSANTQYPTDPTLLLSSTPPYLNQDFFTGTHSGYTFTQSLTAYNYTVTAVPVTANQGNYSYTVSTGGYLRKN